MQWPTTIALGGAALLAIVCLVQISALRQSNRQTVQVWIAAGLNILFATALWLFLWPPATTQTQTEVIVLTPSATTAQRARARRARHAVALGAVTLTEGEQRNITRITDLAGIETLFGSVATLRVLGAGIAPDEWPAVRPWEVEFSPPTEASGVRSADWPRELETGAPFTVTGALNAATPPNVNVHLLDPAGDIVATAQADGQQRFELTDATRAPGNFLYGVRVDGGGGDIIEQVTIPVSVLEPEPVQLLMLWSAPSFEARYLTDWARNAGASIATRIAISRDRYREQFVRAAQRSLTTITPAIVAGFDAVLLDARSWSALSGPERDSLIRSVREDGLGILMLVPRLADLDAPASEFPGLRIGPGGASSLALDLTATVTRGEIALASPETTLIESGIGEPLAGFRRADSGRFGITLVTDSYQLVTSGQAATHAQYWQSLIDGMAPGEPTLTMDVQPVRPVANKRTALCFRGTDLPGSASLRNTAQNAQQIRLVTQALHPGERCGYWWPARVGWHRVNVGTSTKHVYVHAEQDWRVARDATSAVATSLIANGDVTQRTQEQRVTSVWSRVPFAIGALLIGSWLWWEQKNRG
ncbi:MAG: hypothetical protein AB8G17_06450 [Gammaproteobacteria bacterium]